jgi:hypothetical protein
MKRTYKRPDGTEEMLEGTADELAAYEREQAKNGLVPIPETTTPKPGILHGGSVDGVAITEQEADWVRLSRNLAKTNPIKVPWKSPPYERITPFTWPDTVPQWPDDWYSKPMWIATCPVCSQLNCMGHNSGAYYKFSDVKSITVSSNTLKLNDPTKLS